jgi:hypothetical protein
MGPWVMLKNWPAINQLLRKAEEHTITPDEVVRFLELLAEVAKAFGFDIIAHPGDLNITDWQDGGLHGTSPYWDLVHVMNSAVITALFSERIARIANSLWEGFEGSKGVSQAEQADDLEWVNPIGYAIGRTLPVGAMAQADLERCALVGLTDIGNVSRRGAMPIEQAAANAAEMSAHMGRRYGGAMR